MYRLLSVRNQVKIEAVHIERSYWSGQDRNVLENLVKGLVCGQLVFGKAAAPETLAVQADVPVGKMVADKVLDEASCKGDVIVLVSCADVADEGVHQGDDPPVGLRAEAKGHVRSGRVEAVHVCVQREE